ncbi:MAG: zinc ABC transporter substrate-binding protein [bacterium]|nr:zinc ABC transporter substrate-binding protein [bacterium]
MRTVTSKIRVGRAVRGPVPALALAALALAALACGAAGCGGAGERRRDGPLNVVATTGMVADAAARIGGDRVRVVGLMGPGVDPHLYKASEGDVRRLQEADLVLYNGLHLEAKMGEVLGRLGATRPARAVASAVDPADLQATPGYAGAHDPHIWFDVRLWRNAVTAVGEALAAADPPGAADYRRRLDDYRAELDSLDAWVRRRVATVPAPSRVLATAHDAFGYFGRAYGLEVRGLQGTSTATEAGTRDVQDLAAFLAERRVPAVFVESSVPPRAVEALQAAVRARGHDVRIGGSLYSDALGDPGGPAATYVGMVRANVTTIVEALGGAKEAP